MKCYIVRDLLPNYIDGLTGEEVSTDVKEHLESCEDCRRIYEQMSAELPKEIPEQKGKKDFLGKLKGRMRKQNVKTVFIVCIVLAVLIFFARNYNIPVPFDPEHMTVGICHVVAIPNPPYTTVWQDVDHLDFETTKAFLEGEYDTCETRDLVRLYYLGYNTRICRYGRTIRREEEEVDVVYYCAARSLWDCFIQLSDPGADQRGGWQITGNLDEGLIYHAGYVPRKTEIYYLPVTNYSRLKRLSDEAFDAERKKAVLVWNGVI